MNLAKVLAPLRTPAGEQSKAIGGAVYAALVTLLSLATAHASVTEIIIGTLIAGVGTWLGVYHLDNNKTTPPGA